MNVPGKQYKSRVKVFQERTNSPPRSMAYSQSILSPDTLKPSQSSKYLLRPTRTSTRRTSSASQTLPVIRSDSVPKQSRALQLLEHRNKAVQQRDKELKRVPPASDVPATVVGTQPTEFPNSHGHHPRSLRYLKDEQALAETLQRCHLEAPSHELLIEAVKRAASFLNARATDAAERVDKLREMLANRATEPDLYKSLQRERWMEERRQLAAQHISKLIHQHLSLISSQGPPSQPIPAHSNAKSNANLVKFLETSSRQRAPLRNRIRRRFPGASRPRSDKTNDLPRIHDHKHPLPLLLTVSKSKPKPLFMLKFTQPIPPISKPQALSHTRTPSTPPSSQSPALEPITEVSQIVHGVPSTPSQPTGTATIWRNGPRPKDEILADLVVTMPSYAVELIKNFDSNSTNKRATLHHHSSSQSSPNSSSSPRSGSSFPKTPPQPPLHKATSRRRISALFSLSETISSRLGSNAAASWPRRFSSPPSTVAAIREESMLPLIINDDTPSDPGDENLPLTHAHDNNDKVIEKLRKRFSSIRGF